MSKMLIIFAKRSYQSILFNEKNEVDSSVLHYRKIPIINTQKTNELDKILEIIKLKDIKFEYIENYEKSLSN